MPHLENIGEILSPVYPVSDLSARFEYSQERMPVTLDKAPVNFTPDPFHELQLTDELSKLHSKLVSEVFQEPVIRRLMDKLIKVKDKNTFAHCYRVGTLMVAAALYTGSPPDEAKIAGRIGFTHDVGKSLPPIQAAILDPRQMNGELFAIIKTHPWYGANLARQAGMSGNVQQGIGNHHAQSRRAYGVYEQVVAVEESDGKRPDLGKMLHMITCCDAYDALTARRRSPEERPYQASREAEDYSNKGIEAVLQTLYVPDDIKISFLDMISLARARK